MIGNSWGPGGARASHTPVTIGWIAANVVVFLAIFATNGALPVLPFLPLDGESLPWMPWTVLTWALVPGRDLFGLLFGGLWMWWVGSSLERSWGSRTFALFVCSTTAITGIATWGLARVLHAPFVLYGLTVATAAPTLVWCWINRRETIVFSFLFPIPALWLGWITLGFAWYTVSTSSGNPILGIAALAGPGAGWWWATRGRYRMRGPSRGSNLRFSDFDRTPGASTPRPTGIAGWFAAWRARRRDARLERMFRNSGYDDDRR
ncbi:MAG: rhomboid family intramembrane serine protease [Armatimonadota bacterium]